MSKSVNLNVKLVLAQTKKNPLW